MALVYTLDASVVLSAFLPHEVDHEDSRDLLRAILDRALPLVEPTLLLPEIGATLARGQQSPEGARRFVTAFARTRGLVLVPFDPPLAHDAAMIAIDQRLRGADAVYVTVAQRFGATLVTRDHEQLDRAGAIVTTLSPGAALAILRA